MRTLLAVVLVVLALIAAACDGEPSQAPSRPVGATSEAAPAGDEAAPDFALELGNGGTFLLSEEARPVFMVFWAEW